MFSPAGLLKMGRSYEMGFVYNAWHSEAPQHVVFPPAPSTLQHESDGRNSEV